MSELVRLRGKIYCTKYTTMCIVMFCDWEEDFCLVGCCWWMKFTARDDWRPAAWEGIRVAVKIPSSVSADCFSTASPQRFANLFSIFFENHLL